MSIAGCKLLKHKVSNVRQRQGFCATQNIVVEFCGGSGGLRVVYIVLCGYMLDACKDFSINKVKLYPRR